VASPPLALEILSDLARQAACGDAHAAHELMLNHIESSRKRFIPAVEALNAKI
jgi:DNA-binding GntR family transcriptional regulator